MINTEENLPKGILGFPVTPLKNDGKVDYQALEKNIDFLVNEKLSAIFVACGAGEFQSLSAEEYRNAVEIAVKKVGGKVPVYTGVGGNITSALEQAQVSEELGANGYLILPPYLIHGEQEGIYQYYEMILRSTNLNGIMYQRDNAVASLETIKKLASIKQLVGVKDGLGNMELNINLTQQLGERFRWMNGMPLAELTMPAYYPIGFDTYSSAISNYIPHISRLHFEAVKNGEKELLRNLYQDVILPINDIRVQRKGYAVSLIKAGMEIVGLPIGQTVRPPVVPVEKEHYLQLEKIIRTALDKYPVGEYQTN